MNKMLKIVLTAALILGGMGILFADDTQSQLDSLVEKWTDSLLNEDIDGFLSCYWDDAVRIMYFPGRDTEITEGINQLRASEKASFEQLDYRNMNLIYDEPVRFFPGDCQPIYIYPNSRFSFMDVFEFEERRGQYRIIKQYLIPHPAQE
ncbi:MAG: hypothetical protein KAH21_00825 [Spirochaetaceae bacterium]|nr:hypothetical protein [Spirochaetaceae bacterium]